MTVQNVKYINSKEILNFRFVFFKNIFTFKNKNNFQSEKKLKSNGITELEVSYYYSYQKKEENNF